MSGGGGFRRPPTPSQNRAPGASPPTFASRRLGAALAGGVDEIIGERGSGKLTEMLVRWRGSLASRPSWVLLTDLQAGRNESFDEAYAEYLERGVQTLEPLE